MHREGIKKDNLDEVEAQFLHPELKERLMAAAVDPSASMEE